MTDEPRPWLTDTAQPSGGRRHAPATLRNRDAIAGVLAAALPDTGLVLEVASGSGEHVVHFADRFAHLRWQPSDPDPAALDSIAGWAREAALPNLLPPVQLDAASADWPVANAAAILCINMVHISRWEATLGLMGGARRLLRVGGLLYLYGPYIQAGVETAASNLVFDASLRARNPDWGIRAMEDVAAVAAKNDLMPDGVIAMPANNLSLLFRRV